MLISTNNILQSIQSSTKIDNDPTKDTNKESIKDKQASTILNSTSNEFKNQSQIKTVQDMVQNVLKELSSNTTSNQSALNSLKNSSVLQDLGSLSKDIQPLTTMIKDEPKLAKFEPVLNQFMTSVKDLDAKTLETKIKQTGIFLESKLLNQAKTTTIDKPLKQLLQDLKSELNKLDIPQAKPILEKITNIESNIKDTPKVLQQEIKDVATQIKQIDPKQLSSNKKDILNKLQGLNTKLEQLNTKPIIQQQNSIDIKSTTNTNIQESIPTQPKVTPQIKEVLTQIKQLVDKLPNGSETTQINRSIDNLISANKQDIQIPIQNSKADAVQLAPLKDALKVLDSIKQPIEELSLQTKTSNMSMVKKQEIVQVDTKLQTTIEQIKVKLDPNQQNQNMQMKDLENLQTNVKDLLQNIKQNPTIRAVLQDINPTFQSSMQNIIDQPKIILPNQQILSQDNLSQNIKNIVNQIKQNIDTQTTQLSQNQSTPLQQLANKLDTMISQPLQNSLLLTPTNQENTKQIISNDMKAVLLVLKEEASSIDTPQAKEIVKQADKMIGQIEYFQALSYASATQSTFLPFIWDSMEEGQISFKKLKEDKFFVQINLTLKEYGKIDLMVILHNQNQLDISMFAQKDEFKNIVQENMPKLKQSINKAGLIASNIRLLDMQKDDDVKKQADHFVEQQQIGQGISIRV